MRLKRTLLKDAKLYLILDRQVHSYEQLFEIAQKAVAAGADVIQLRDKIGSAKDILDFSRRILKITKGGPPYIINDRVDLAMIAPSSGVHLGQEDIPLTAARKILGKKVLIGISCQTLAHAQKAQDDGADYIGFGSVFKTLTKPERSAMDLGLLETVLKNIKIPVFAIGGIDLKNITRLTSMGVTRIAVCRAILEACDVSKAVQQFKASIA
jgi:thiamine-phosphate pyrophosphorylase